ncbi:hypothetical protein [Neobacillus mesonae]|uniref:hypothetical protein n=1 Tax=Neobacillus mesonae TaxID=1193713 RepID=UPI00082BFA1A|nr:hypothetical protein [Neobacillus mesonae]
MDREYKGNKLKTIAFDFTQKSGLDFQDGLLKTVSMIFYAGLSSRRLIEDSFDDFLCWFVFKTAY